MSINIFVCVFLIISLFIILPTLFLLVLKNKKRNLKLLGIVSFTVYVIAIFILVFSDVSVKGNNIMIKFITNNEWFSLNFILSSFSLKNILYNLVMFIPISAFVYTITEKSVLIKTLLIAFSLSIFIEVMQFILPVNRITELFDIFTNVMSSLIGYLYFRIVIKIRDKI